MLTEALKPLIVVTGASQGIGAALARVFAEEMRCRLALVARNEANLEKVADDCRAMGAEVAVFCCDVTDATAVAEMGTSLQAQLGDVDVLINNAGLFRPSSFLDMKVEEFDEMINANLRSLFLVSKELVPAMVERKRGHVFVMSSVAGLNGYPMGAGYCAAKFGVTGLAKVMREELRESGVRVTIVYPGATYTPSWDGAGFPEERMMPAADVA
ncbi:MAG: SDR family oxidoreductase, partial [Opitutaceae bacterium]|nr:SDR family oxidoreductase [Opitutaceae bacterium]